jgi:hypothetical protein
MSQRYRAASCPASRRQILRAAPGLALNWAAEVAPPEDQAFALCRRWRALEKEDRRLIREWQREETGLFERHEWPRLTEAQQQALPQARRLYEIDARLDGLRHERELLLPKIKTQAARSRAGALQKLEVLAALLKLEDQQEACALLRSAQRDLASLWR